MDVRCACARKPIRFVTNELFTRFVSEYVSFVRYTLDRLLTSSDRIDARRIIVLYRFVPINLHGLCAFSIILLYGCILVNRFYPCAPFDTNCRRCQFDINYTMSGRGAPPPKPIIHVYIYKKITHFTMNNFLFV